MNSINVFRMFSMLNESQQINLYIIKLGIEETYVNNKLKMLEARWNQKNNL